MSLDSKRSHFHREQKAGWTGALPGLSPCSGVSSNKQVRTPSMTTEDQAGDHINRYGDLRDSGVQDGPRTTKEDQQGEGQCALSTSFREGTPYFYPSSWQILNCHRGQPSPSTWVSTQVILSFFGPVNRVDWRPPWPGHKPRF